jgi:hypothetical protein
MPHRTWIPLIGWFIDRLISEHISCLIDWPIDWLTEISGADGRGSEDDGVDGLNDCSTEDPSDDPTRGPSDGSTWGPSGGPPEGSSGGPSGCFEFSVVGTCSELPMVGGCSGFSMIGDDCLSTDWFSDCPSDCPSDWPPDCPSGWPPGCSSSWLCGGERNDMDDEVSDRLYDEMRGNRLYNCLLNADENSDDWKNFENRNEIDCRSVDWFSDESDERTERDEIGDEGLWPKFVFRRILMMMKMKFS